MATKVTIRVPSKDFGGKVGQAYYAVIDGVKIFFPCSITEIEEVGEYHVDINVDKWYAVKNDLETIAEWNI